MLADFGCRIVCLPYYETPTHCRLLPYVLLSNLPYHIPYHLPCQRPCHV